MLLGNMLLALAWAALQGEFSLANLRDRTRARVSDSLGAGQGRRAADVPVHRQGLIAQSAWRRSFSGSWFARTCGWRWTWRHRASR